MLLNMRVNQWFKYSAFLRHKVCTSEVVKKALKSLTLPPGQKLNWIGAIALPGFKRPDTTVRRPAILAVIQGAAVIEKRETPAIDLNRHEAVVDFAQRLAAGSCHDACAQRDVLQYLVDLAGGKRRGCVQIILRSGHRVSKAKLRYEVALMERLLVRANGPGSLISRTSP